VIELRRAAGALGLLAALGAGPAAAQTADAPVGEPEPGQRSVSMVVALITADPLPVPGSRAVARFRVVDGEFRGALFSLAYDFERPVRLRSWDVHDASGFHRIGGARFVEPPTGQWDALLIPGSPTPVAVLEVTLVQTRLFPEERRERWHFTKLESIVPRSVLDPLRNLRY
jgi:hypothetical protein